MRALTFTTQGWRHITKRAAQDVPLEKQIAADVSKKLAKTVDRDVAQALHVELHGRAAREGRTQLIPDYTYKRGGYAGDDSSNLQKTPAGNYYGQFHGGAGNVHTGTYGAVGGSDPRTRLTRAQRKLVRHVLVLAGVHVCVCVCVRARVLRCHWFILVCLCFWVSKSA
jgi:hypothetical protein